MDQSPCRGAEDRYSGDLRSALDCLIVADLQLLGQNSGREIAVMVKDDSPQTKALHGEGN